MRPQTPTCKFGRSLHGEGLRESGVVGYSAEHPSKPPRTYLQELEVAQYTKPTNILTTNNQQSPDTDIKLPSICSPLLSTFREDALQCLSSYDCYYVAISTPSDKLKKPDRILRGYADSAVFSSGLVQ
jgi:hypothetical protein